MTRYDYEDIAIRIFQDGDRYLGFGPTGNSTIRSADSENPILEPNMK